MHCRQKSRLRGKESLLVEKSKLGGVCLNEGCVPSKTLLQAAKLTTMPSMDQFLVWKPRVTFDYLKAHEHKNNVMNKMRDGIAGLEKVQD